MLFEYLAFRNYRPFFGEQRLDFRPLDKSIVPEKTVTLIGGLNGAGKTSILNALFACLYGQRSFNTKDYTRLKSEAINRHYLAIGGKTSSVELGIITPTRLKTGRMAMTRYAINVTWVKSRNSIEESRTVYSYDAFSNNRKIVSATPADCDDFIETLLPKELAPLFIFDAEDLGNLVSDTSRTETVRAIQRLVSLDLYKEIRRDLESRLNKVTQDLSKHSADKEQQQLANTLAAHESTMEQLNIEYQENERALQEAEKQARLAEDNLRNKTATNTKSRMKLQGQIDSLRNQADELAKAVQKSLGNALPYAFLTPLITKMRQRLGLELKTMAEAQAYKNATGPFDRVMGNILSVDITPPLTKSQKDQLAIIGRKAWCAALKNVPQAPPPSLTIRHEVTNSIQRVLETWDLKETTDLTTLEAQRTATVKQINELKDQLSDAPEEVDVKTEREAFSVACERVADLKANGKSLNEKRRKLMEEISGLRRKISDQEKSLKSCGPLSRKRSILDDLVGALTDFTESATQQTAISLKHGLESAVTILLNKRDVARLEFDPTTYTMHLYDNAGQEIPIEQCSEGEKQVISLSLVWALTKVSGASIPFVIDTPLARLDYRHRKRLVDHFFPKLSDQVLILSTDTEIDAQFLKDIEPFVRNRFLLEPIAGKQSTQIREGYFDFVPNEVTA